MTLILSMVTPDYVVQVSDRILTRVQDGKIVGFVKNANKSVLYSNAIAFGYTGIAQIDGEDTDFHFANLLASTKDPDFGERLNIVAKSLSGSFLKANYAKQICRHAFVGVGWGGLRNDPQRYSMLLRVSNYDRPKKFDDPLPEARDHFHVECILNKPPRKTEWQWWSAGVSLMKHEADILTRRFRQCVRKGVGPQTVAQLFINTIRTVARRTQIVGKDVLITVLPIYAAKPGQQHMLMNSGCTQDLSMLSDPDNMSFHYLPEGGTGPVQFAPIMVSESGTVIYNARLEGSWVGEPPRSTKTA